MKRSLTLALCLSTSLLAGSVLADDAELKIKTGDSYTKKDHHTQFSSSHQIHAKNLLGARINDMQGQKIGQVEDLVINPTSSRVQFAVVRLSGDLAPDGKAFTPIPLTAIRPETMRSTTTDQPKTYVLTVDRSKLQSASRFNVERWPAEQSQMAWGPEVYSHYGMSSSTGATGASTEFQSGQSYRDQTYQGQGLEVKETQEPPIDYTEKSIDNGTAPDGKGTFPFLHEQTDQD